MSSRVWSYNGRVSCFSLSTLVGPSQNVCVYLSLLDLFYEHRYSHTEMVNPDFVQLAQAMGVHAIRCHTAEELPVKMKEFLEYDNNKPVVMECVVEKNEHVFPMVRFCLAVSRLMITDWYHRLRLERLYTSTSSILRWQTRKHKHQGHTILHASFPIPTSSSFQSYP